MSNAFPSDWLTGAQATLMGKLEANSFTPQQAGMIAEQVLGMIRGIAIEHGMNGKHELNELVSAASAAAENLPANQRAVLKAMQTSIHLRAGQLVEHSVPEMPRSAPGPVDRSALVAGVEEDIRSHKE